MARIICFIGIAFIIFFIAGCRDEEDETISNETLEVNEWILTTLSSYYLWNDELPESSDYSSFSSPKIYFDSLLVDEDRWSYITDDYSTLSSDLEGTPTSMGYSPAFYLISSSSRVIIAVKYVYPNSPADIAGIKRGDLILTIDGESLNTSNYYTLYSQDSYTVGLGEVNGDTISLTGETISLTAGTISADPIVFSSMIDSVDHKIAYLVYVGFVTGTNDQYLDSLDDVFNTFKQEGVTDLIVDLRYNSGGYISAASYLASEIAPASVVSAGEILVNLVYNDELQSLFENSSSGSDYLQKNFNSEVTGNLDLNHVYFLTTGSTASASELLMIGLDSYMTTTRIGEYTSGKYVGSWVIAYGDTGWAMMPIVTKYSNIDGFTDFSEGLEPDYAISDDIIGAYDFGNLSDPMLSEAVSLIIGGESSKTSIRQSGIPNLYRQIYPSTELNKRNLYLKMNEGKLIY